MARIRRRRLPTRQARAATPRRSRSPPAIAKPDRQRFQPALLRQFTSTLEETSEGITIRHWATLVGGGQARAKPGNCSLHASPSAPARAGQARAAARDLLETSARAATPKRTVSNLSGAALWVASARISSTERRNGAASVCSRLCHKREFFCNSRESSEISLHAGVTLRSLGKRPDPFWLTRAAAAIRLYP
jgi:hypothetical protein